MKKVEQKLELIYKDKNLMKKIKELLLEGKSYAKIGILLNQPSYIISLINKQYFNIKLKHIWSKNDKTIAKKMIKEGKTYKEIAKRLNKNPKAILCLNSKYWKVKYLRNSQGFLRKLPNFNEKQKQLIYGSLLGDGYISKIGYFQINHSIKQSNYLYYKAKFLNNFLTSKSIWITNNEGWGGRLIHLRTRTHNFLKELRKKLYKDRSYFPKEIIYQLIPFSLAIWYMDDGGINRGIVTISAYSLNYLTVKNIQKFLKIKYLIKLKIKNTEKGYIFKLDRKNSNEFIELIKKHVCPSMQYKCLVTPLKMNVKCFICNNNFNVTYQYYKVRENRGQKFLCSERCRIKRRKETYKRRYEKIKEGKNEN